ncbi:pseudouridine synthase [Rubinisphaera sp.]|uniref:pseudouridine synthase n=1 Tax=Rubinisphaera sp. TaxID=2024857 RepID=UPI000C0FDFFF|nr:pseudouridine synthase [Rubinisphaera sp.]MBV11204.1 ribosomal large subunit pseudouridine synthase B [Rubinisphaera sp.]|tara:strand:- start:3326 stop:4300 length:975 start_codon:yes stop_codon:yes gene_type:complete
MPKPNTSQSRPRKSKAERPVEAPEEYRLQKFLASAGLGSRRKCEEIIRSGRIMVDGEPVDNPGMNVNPLTQVISFDEERLKPQPHKYFALNKPKGVLCTNHDPAGRARVIDLFEKERVRLFPVGRLDEESEGLLIVTNDGEFANQLAHPRYRIYRTYRVQVVGDPKPEQIQQLKQGIYFKEGKFKFVNVHRAGRQGRSTFLEVTLGQGHNREVRRLFARIGHKVMSLERIAFGPIKLGKLKSGQYRPLTDGELNELREMLVRNRQTLTPTPEKTPRPRKPSPRAEGENKREGDRRPASARKSATPEKKRIFRKSKSNSPVSRKK